MFDERLFVIVVIVLFAFEIDVKWILILFERINENKIESKKIDWMQLQLAFFVCKCVWMGGHNVQEVLKIIYMQFDPTSLLFSPSLILSSVEFFLAFGYWKIFIQKLLRKESVVDQSNAL